MWFFTADWHLNHANIIKYCSRPFLDVEEQALLELVKKGTLTFKDFRISSESLLRMNNSIIESVNQTVSENDNLVIIGDICWSSTSKKDLGNILSKIRCKNLFLIWGNNDNRKTFKDFFKATYDSYIFNIEGQRIFASHYPCRSWPLMQKGSWMLYGHAHNSLWHYDNCFLTEQENKALNQILDCVPISKFKETKKSILSLFRKKSFTLDVGVDNIREEVPFGTPWSFNDILAHMESKV